MLKLKRSSKEASGAYAVLSDPEKRVSMISLVMLLLTECGSRRRIWRIRFSTVLILATFSEISSEICSAAGEEPVVRTRDR